MKKVRVTLTEAINLLQELDYVPGVSMAVPDFNYTVNKRKNFEPVDSDDPLDTFGRGPQNAQGDGQQGVGRGGVGWGGRPDHSGGIREPSSTYNDTWNQNESPDYDELERHGRPRNVWRDTPDGKTMKNRVDAEEKIGEAMGSPTQIGPVAPMDGPQHYVLNFSGSVDDMLPHDEKRGVGTMWGRGANAGQERGWASSPSMGEPDVWDVPKENDMKLREFFDPKPVDAEPLTNPGQDYLNDGTDEEIETDVDGLFHRSDTDTDDNGDLPGVDGDSDPQSFAGRYGGETILLIPNPGHGTEFMMSPDKFGAARGTYGMHTDQKNTIPNDLLDKRSAWDVLQHVISAMARREQEQEKPQNIDNTSQPG